MSDGLVTTASMSHGRVVDRRRLGARPMTVHAARRSAVVAALGAALVVVVLGSLALVLLLWSYISLGSRIDSLEGEAQLLRAAVAERDELINAQRARLDEVRGRVKDLLQIVEQPVMSAPAAGPEAPEASPAPPPEDP